MALPGTDTNRNGAIVVAVMKYGYSQNAVADHVELLFTRVNQIVQ